MDTVSKERRSEIMSLIRSRDTSPEMAVRSLVHRLGYRFRLHCRDLPGSPDLVFRLKKKVIFVHGCFFHRHKGCSVRIPKSNVNYWRRKLDGNVCRDIKVRKTLALLGWHCLVVWECQTTRKHFLQNRIMAFLGELKQPTRSRERPSIKSDV